MNADTPPPSRSARPLLHLVILVVTAGLAVFAWTLWSSWDSPVHPIVGDASPAHIEPPAPREDLPAPKPTSAQSAPPRPVAAPAPTPPAPEPLDLDIPDLDEPLRQIRVAPDALRGDKEPLKKQLRQMTGHLMQKKQYNF